MREIYRDAIGMLPMELRDGCEETLAQALNEFNRINKRAKFAFATSEDHVTWTVFRHLQMAGELDRLFFANTTASDQTSLLIWGSPVPAGDEQGTKSRSKLIDVSNQLGERPDRRSEPDVVLVHGRQKIVFVEVKHMSPNDLRPDEYSHWERYLQGTSCFSDPDGIRATGHYELARNWRIACDFAAGFPFELINLGPDSLFEGPAGNRLSQFEAALNQSSGRFRRLPWGTLFAKCGTIPEWLEEYLILRKIRRPIFGQA